jgi:biotin carboxyl carrier protein
MKTYNVVLDGAAAEVGIKPLSGGRYRVVIEGTIYDVDARAIGPDFLSLIVDSRTLDIAFSPDGEAWELHGKDRRHHLLFSDGRRKAGWESGAGAGAAGPAVVKAAMPGKIVQVEVKEGDLVAPGTGLLIIEAMKMENEIRSEGTGIVKAIRVKPGDAVERDAVLIEIGPAE